jgi:cysteinyl-tRNA synthetase
MEHDLHVYNTLSRKKEKFEPLHAPNVGMYVCGPTVYGDAHLGHARSAITFDTVFRYLKHVGFKVRYVRNITDVGHLENDADHGEDKIAKKARLDQLEPMEVVQHYMVRYQREMDALGCNRPSISPQASGHIIEQIAMTQKILDNGYAYESNGSVYFDVPKYNESHPYGKLSGRVVEDLLSNTRETAGQQEKRSPLDFALWKKASPEHIMRWPSPWSDGFPGWHIECSVMSSKYLGNHFDIHGGGLDLLFPHHECEIAQSVAAEGDEAVKYWLHNNMITLNGQKMAKSLGNTIMLHEFFDGNHELLEQSYGPMSIRFFMLQAHYRSTLDFGNEPLQAAEKGLAKLSRTMRTLESIDSSKLKNSNGEEDAKLTEMIKRVYSALDDDLNTALAIAVMFELGAYFNTLASGKASASPSAKVFESARSTFQALFHDVLGLQLDESNSNSESMDAVMQMVLELRTDAKKNKDFGTADKIRDDLKKAGISIMDTPEGTKWEHGE